VRSSTPRLVRTGSEIAASGRFSNAWLSESLDAPGGLNVEIAQKQQRRQDRWISIIATLCGSADESVGGPVRQ
jgi:hypothetical protein